MNTDKKNKHILIQTIGHSTRTIEDFLRLLNIYQVEEVIDIRTIPRSRKNHQFNQEILPGSLEGVKIAYRHMPGLGGLRHPQKDSLNLGWRNTSFRGFADYMQTPEFEQNLDELIRFSGKTRSALMCAEAVSWRCHRSLIADALIIRGLPVEHILSPTKSYPHKLTPWAKVVGLQITYPPGSESEPLSTQADKD
jgi:uncharacterized protein (DUF488 family)